MREKHFCLYINCFGYQIFQILVIFNVKTATANPPEKGQPLSFPGNTLLRSGQAPTLFKNLLGSLIPQQKREGAHYA